MKTLCKLLETHCSACPSGHGEKGIKRPSKTLSYLKNINMLIKTLLLTFTILTAVQSSFSQDIKLTDDVLNSSGAIQMTLMVKQNCDKVNQLFKKDLERKTIFLLLQGGEAPIVYTTDKDFENKYRVYYYDYGCIAPDQECLKRYNYLAFAYLTKTFGKKWRYEVRKDIIGLKEWRKNTKGL